MGRPKKYTPSVISYIRKNCGKVSKQEMMEKLGVTYNALSKLLCDLRKKYKTLPKYPSRGTKQCYQIGDMVTRHTKGRPPRVYVKTAEGWVEQRRKDMKRFKNKAPGSESAANPRPRRFTAPVMPIVSTSQTILLLPTGGSVLCDSGKVEATIRYLQKHG